MRFDLLALVRWLVEQDLRLEAVDTDALLRFLAFRPKLRGL
jgi:hypothetical protein